LKKWGVSVILSDKIDVQEGYRYNFNDFLSLTYNSITYELGSINMYNYKYEDLLGPNVYDDLPPNDEKAGIYKYSNMYFKAGSSLTDEIHGKFN